MTKHYVYIWEFKVSPERRAEFEQHYGVDGSWVRLFRLAKGYVQTALLHDRSDEQRYITIDRWQDEPAYLAFRADFLDEYTSLDKKCEHLTICETSLGVFYE